MHTRNPVISPEIRPDIASHTRLRPLPKSRKNIDASSAAISLLPPSPGLGILLPGARRSPELHLLPFLSWRPLVSFPLQLPRPLDAVSCFPGRLPRSSRITILEPDRLPDRGGKSRRGTPMRPPRRHPARPHRPGPLDAVHDGLPSRFPLVTACRSHRRVCLSPSLPQIVSSVHRTRGVVVPVCIRVDRPEPRGSVYRGGKDFFDPCPASLPRSYVLVPRSRSPRSPIAPSSFPGRDAANSHAGLRATRPYLPGMADGPVSNHGVRPSPFG